MSICENCNTKIENKNVQFCPNCGAELSAFQMKWFKFLIYFALFLGAVVNFYIGSQCIIIGIHYGQSYYPVTAQTALVRMIWYFSCGVGFIAFACFRIYVRTRLAKYKANGPMCIYILYGAKIGLILLFSIGLSAFFAFPDMKWVLWACSVALIVTSAGKLLANYVYFKKRKALFNISKQYEHTNNVDEKNVKKGIAIKKLCIICSLVILLAVVAACIYGIKRRPYKKDLSSVVGLSFDMTMDDIIQYEKDCFGNTEYTKESDKLDFEFYGSTSKHTYYFDEETGLLISAYFRDVNLLSDDKDIECSHAREFKNRLINKVNTWDGERSSINQKYVYGHINGVRCEITYTEMDSCFGVSRESK